MSAGCYRAQGPALAFTGDVYVVAHGFPPRSLATAIGATLCVGMLGESAGQLVVRRHSRFLAVFPAAGE